MLSCTPLARQARAKPKGVDAKGAKEKNKERKKPRSKINFVA
jgi:hypothetical protein